MRISDLQKCKSDLQMMTIRPTNVYIRPIQMRISDLQKCKSDLQSVNIRPTISVNPTYKCIYPTYNR